MAGQISYTVTFATNGSIKLAARYESLPQHTWKDWGMFTPSFTNQAVLSDPIQIFINLYKFIDKDKIPVCYLDPLYCRNVTLTSALLRVLQQMADSKPKIESHPTC